MDAVIIIIVFMSFCTILSLGIGIASYLQYKQNLKYTPDLKYKSFLENAGNTVLSFIKNAASTLTPAPALTLTPAPALTLIPVLTPASTPVLTPAPALTLIPDSLPAPALTPASTPAPALIPESLPPVPTTPAPTTPAPTTPAPTTPAPRKPQAGINYIPLFDRDSPGYDITYFDDVYYTKCQTECSNRPDCKGFGFSSESYQPGTCYIKSNVSNITKKSGSILYQKTDKSMLGDQGEIANFGCAVDKGFLKFADAKDAEAKVYEYSLYDQDRNIQTNLDNLIEIGGKFNNEINVFLKGKWYANYICKKPVHQGYSRESHTKLGGDVLWENKSATFEECKIKCDNYGDQCQVFNYSSSAIPTARWDSKAKGECSLRSSRNKNNETSNTEYDVFEKIKIGQTLSCYGYDPKATTNYTYYRYMGNNKMSWYPSDDIVKSWDPKFDDVYTDCTGYELTGEDMKMKE